MCKTVIYAHRSTMWGPTQNNSPNPMLLGSRLADFIIDGVNTINASGAIGLDVGDCWGIEVQDVMLKNFAGPGVIGFYQANRTDWSEKCRFRLTCINCTNCVVVDSPAGNVSHEYNDWDLYLYMLPGQNGITWQNGAFQGGGRLFIRGNHNPSAEGQPTGSVITVGGGPNDGRSDGQKQLWSQLYNVEFDVVLESNGNSTSNGTGSYGPNMVTLVGKNNSLAGFGQIVAQFDGWSPSVLNGGAVKFTGRVHGDPGLTTIVNTPVLAQGKLFTNSGDDAIVCVSGGSVDEITVNGVTTGLTSGTFYVCQNGTIQIKYSSAPSWVWYPSSC